MALAARFRADSALAPRFCHAIHRSAAPRRRLLPWAPVLAVVLLMGGPQAGALADEAAVGPVAAVGVPRSVTISVRSPIKVVEGDKVTLQSMLRFSGRAWEDARIEILANGVVVSETIAMRGGLWYAPRTVLAPGAYEFSARAFAADGTNGVSDILRITVSPPILIDPESLAGKNAYWVG